ncbi:MAG: BolA/IbaG family iron-sulfur metabolism protein [bacterium]|nr:BolA/IbaG family iron-sulfur metabolism protein [Gammaproteobacteria bacterium]HIL98681.1 BolA/IbaG family iron-sulfur metabolism protein [Pseudomonadales bacterium]
MDEAEIRALLVDGLGECEIEMVVDGNRLSLDLVAGVFAALSRLKRQQLVNKLLSQKIRSGEIHAVSMRCNSPDERGGS